MAVRRERLTTNLVNTLGVVEPKGAKEAARQAGLTADAWAEATQQLSQGFKDLQLAVDDVYADNYNKEFKITTDKIVSYDKNGKEVTTTKFNIPKPLNIWWNPEKQEKQNELYVFRVKNEIQTDLAQLIDEKKASILANQGSSDEIKPFVDVISDQIRKETGDELFNLILPTINRLTVGGEKDVQYALNRQTDAQNDLSYTEDLKRIQNIIQSKVTTGLSIEGEIAEINQIVDLYSPLSETARIEGKVVKQSYQDLSAFTKAMSKYLDPVDMVDETSVGIARLQTNAENIKYLLDGVYAQVPITDKDGNTVMLDNKTLVDSVGELSTAGQNIINDALTAKITGLNKMGSEASFEQNLSSAIQGETDGNLFNSSLSEVAKDITDSPDNANKFVQQFSGDPNARFYLGADLNRGVDIAKTVIALSRLGEHNTAELGTMLKNQMKILLNNTDKAGGVLDYIQGVLDRPKYGRPDFMFFGHNPRGDLRDAEYLLNQIIRDKALFGTITEETRNRLRAEEFNVEIAQKQQAVGLRTTDGTDPVRDILNVIRSKFKDKFGAEPPEMEINLLHAGFKVNAGIDGYKASHAKDYFEKRFDSMSQNYYGVSDIQVSNSQFANDKKGVAVRYPINKEIMKNAGIPDGYNEIIKYVMSVVKDDGYFATDDERKKAIKRGLGVDSDGLSLMFAGDETIPLNDISKVPYLIIKNSNGFKEPLINKNTQEVIVVYPFANLEMKRKLDLSMIYTEGQLKRKGMQDKEYRRRLEDILNVRSPELIK